MYCVLVGDLMNSKEMKKEERLTWDERLRVLLLRLNAEYKEQLFIEFTVVRGDAFEGVLYAAHVTPRIARTVFRELHPFRMRVAAALGTLTTVGEGTNANIADGEAFHRAWAALDKQRGRSGKKRAAGWLNFSTDVPSEDVQPVLDGLAALLAERADGWTDRQRDIVWAMERLAGQRKAAAEALGVTPAAISKQLGAVGYAAYARGWDALEGYLASLDLAADPARTEPPRPDDGYVSLLNVGYDLHEKGNYGAALPVFEKALEQARAAEAGTAQLVDIENRIARLLVDLARYDEAAERLKHILDSPGYAISRVQKADTLMLLGSARREQKRYGEALDACEQARNIYREHRGETHPDTGRAYNNIGLIYRKQGSCEKALEYYEKALAIAQATLPPDHPGIATVYHNIGLVYSMLGLYLRAGEFYKKAIDISEKTSGRAHPDTANSYAAMGQMYKKMGEPDKALEYYEKAHAIVKKMFGPEHPYTTMIMKNIERLKDIDDGEDEDDERT